MKKRQQNMQIYFIVGVFAILCYINSLSGDFVHDDLPAIVYNRDVLGTSSIADMLLNDFWGMRMKLKESHKSYRPLTTFTFRFVKFPCSARHYGDLDSFRSFSLFPPPSLIFSVSLSLVALDLTDLSLEWRAPCGSTLSMWLSTASRLFFSRESARQ
jgi:hypothetical protein